MSAYIVAQLRFTDKGLYRRYQRQFAQVFAGFDGELLAADEAPAVLEGTWTMDKIVIMKFETSSAAREFLESPAYRSISKDREAGAQTIALLIHGL